MDNKSNTRKWKLFGFTMLALLILTVGGIATADAVDTAGSDAVDACVLNFTGTVRIIDPQHPRPCNDRYERAVSWARQGPQGPQGPAGPAGPQGPPAATIWAVVGPKPVGDAFEVKNGNHATGVSRDDQNVFAVSFDQDVSRCAYQVTPRSTLGLVNHTVEAQPAEQAPNQILVTLTEGTTGNPNRVPFQVTVTC